MLKLTSPGGPRIAAAALVSLLLGGCRLEDYPQSAVNPHSDYARMIQVLLEQQLFWVVVIFVVVTGLLLWAVFRFRNRPGMPDPKPVHGNTALEIAWTIAPAIVLALVGVPTVVGIYKSQASPPPNALVVEAIGHQWWWEFRYPDLGVVTASDMHIPVGKPVIVEIKSNDVLHSFWFPVVGGKRDAVPNHVNRIYFTADTTGMFPGQCAELCGLSHANMRMKLFIQPPQEFDAWVSAQKAPPAQPDSLAMAQAHHGLETFRAGLCVACHTIDGVAAGVIGPNLNHVGSRVTLAGGIMPNTPENMGKWIQNAPSHKPGSLMPNMSLPPDQVEALVAYLQSLK